MRPERASLIATPSLAQRRGRHDQPAPPHQDAQPSGFQNPATGEGRDREGKWKRVQVRINPFEWDLVPWKERWSRGWLCVEIVWRR